MMRHILILTYLLASLSLFSKEPISSGFNKVNETLLIEKEHPIYPDAVAAFDQNRCEITLPYEKNTGFNCVSKITQRIKVYKEEGKAYGNIELFLYKNSNTSREIVTNLKGITYNKEGDKTTTTSLSIDDTYETEINDHYYSLSFAIPNVQIGSVIELSYSIESPFIYHLDLFYMQKRVPVNNMYYSADFPEYFSYNPKIQGYIDIKHEKTQGSGSLKFRDIPQKLHFKSENWVFQATNIPPVEEKMYVHNMKNYMSAISWELSSTEYPGEFVQNYNVSWDEIAKQLQSSQNFGRYIKANSDELKYLKKATKDLNNQSKMEFIYDYISSRYKWNDKYSIGGERIHMFNEEKKGTIGQINLYLVNALMKAGLDAFPIVLQTREYGYLNLSYPSISDLNYVIAGVQTPNGIIFMDATVPNLPLGSLPERALNLNGVIINKSTGTKIEIPSPNIENQTNFIQATLMENGNIKGIQSSKYFKYSNYKERSKINSFEDKNQYIEKIDAQYSTISCENLKIQNLEDQKKPLTVTFDSNFSNLIQKVDGKIFIPSLLNLGLTENPFRAEDRKYNVYFDNVISTKNIVNLTIPKGYIVESLPENAIFTLVDESLIYRYKITQIDNNINITSFIDRKTDHLSYEQYQSLVEIYNEILTKSNEQIVLVKK